MFLNKVKIMLFYYTMKLNRARLHSESVRVLCTLRITQVQATTSSFSKMPLQGWNSRLECRFPRLSGSKKGAYSFKENWRTPIRNQIKPLTVPQHRARPHILTHGER